MPLSNHIGHHNIITKLQTAVNVGKVSHAYLLEGPNGVGKSHLAKNFAGALMCELGGTDMCSVCSSCKKVSALSHPDLIWVDNALAGSKNKKSISIDVVRYIKSDAYVKPFENRYKIYIIPHCDKLEPPAQNALLKILEEPPKYCIIIMLCENKLHFLPTILSRCTTFQLSRLSDDEIREYAIKKYQNTVQNTSRFEGLPYLVDLYLGDEELLQKRQIAMDNFFDFLLGKAGIIPFSEYLESNKEDLDAILDDYLTFTRDLFVLQAGCEVNNEYMSQLKGIQKKIEMENSMGIFDAIYQCKINLSRNANLNISVTMMLMACLEEMNDRSNRSTV